MFFAFYYGQAAAIIAAAHHAATYLVAVYLAVIELVAVYLVAAFIAVLVVQSFMTGGEPLFRAGTSVLTSFWAKIRYHLQDVLVTKLHFVGTIPLKRNYYLLTVSTSPALSDRCHHRCPS